MVMLLTLCLCPSDGFRLGRTPVRVEIVSYTVISITDVRSFVSYIPRDTTRQNHHLPDSWTAWTRRSGNTIRTETRFLVRWLTCHYNDFHLLLFATDRRFHSLSIYRVRGAFHFVRSQLPRTPRKLRCVICF